MHFSSIQQALVLVSTLAIAHVHTYPYKQDNNRININAARAHAIVPNVDSPSKGGADNIDGMPHAHDKLSDVSGDDTSLTHDETSQSSEDTHPRNDQVARQNEYDAGVPMTPPTQLNDAEQKLYHDLRSILMEAKSLESLVRKSDHTREDKQSFEDLAERSLRLWYSYKPNMHHGTANRVLVDVYNRIDMCLGRISRIIEAQPLVELTADQRDVAMALQQLLTQAQELTGTAERTSEYDRYTNEQISEGAKQRWTILKESKQPGQTAVFNEMADLYLAILQVTKKNRKLMGY